MSDVFVRIITLADVIYYLYRSQLLEWYLSFPASPEEQVAYFKEFMRIYLRSTV